MRIVGLLLLGFLVGIVGTVSALNALRQGTEFPRGVMAVKGHHMGQLREAVLADPCERDTARRHLHALRLMADDIEPAFLRAGAQDPVFSRYAEQMAGRIDGMLGQVNHADCAQLRVSIGDVGDGCKACHRDYR